MEKLARYSNHLTFLIRCRNNGLIPDGLRISLPAKLHNTKKLNDISTKTSRSLLRALISDTRTKKARIKKEIDTLTTTIRDGIDEERRSRIMRWCSKAAEKASTVAKTRQKLKFEKLKHARHTTQLDPKKVVKNISRRTLTDDEERVLALGLNYAVTPKQVPYQEIIMATEATARQLDAESAKKLRIGVSDALRTARPPPSNLDKEMKKALKDLRMDEEIVILPADKGNATVVMDKSEYMTKMNRMLEDDTYKELMRDPTSRIETKITRKLRELEKKGYISDKEKKFLSPQCSKPPQIYGLPKIHKEGIPLRPIVSAIGSPTYRLAKKLAKILSPLAGKTSSFIKNSTDFANRIKQTTIQSSDTMVSLDVMSLFTKVPIADALATISNLLSQDESFEEHTAIPAEEICTLTELCLRSTYFEFQGRFFEQMDGAAMGSPLSPVVANLFMEAFESRALEQAPLLPSMWVRYVDDTFVIWPHTDEELETFHANLNTIHPSIQFTYEKEKEGQLPFLDVCVQRRGNTISTSVYRKATHTDRYINFSSHHHPRIKTGVVHCLKQRADKVCDEGTISQERKHLQNTFEANGYPRRLVQQALRKQPRAETEETRSECDQGQTKLLILPYLKNTSEQIERTCQALGVKVVFKSQCTLCRSLTRVKSATPELKKKDVVYETS